jgi:hypothetical protein
MQMSAEFAANSLIDPIGYRVAAINSAEIVSYSMLIAHLEMPAYSL